MRWKAALSEWQAVLVALVVGVGAILVNRWAWRLGFDGRSIGLVGCHFLRAIFMLFAFLAVVHEFRIVAGVPKAAGSQLTLLDVPVVLLILPGCVGCYPLWAVVLVVLAAVFLLRIVERAASRKPVEDRRAFLRSALVIGLFTFTWYEGAMVTRQGLRGLGERIEAKGSSDQLLAWAADVIAERQRRREAFPAVAASAVGLLTPPGNGPFLAAAAVAASAPGEGPLMVPRSEIPDWLDDVMGPFQGVRGVTVRLEKEPYVTLYTGGSAYHFRIDVWPSRASHRPLPWWVGEGAGGLEWRPGVDLMTEGK